MKKSRISSLDGLKGIACILIAFVYHHGIQGLSGARWMAVGKIGNRCVELFFILSGFCMAMAYNEKINTISAKEFIIRRTRKIMPLYWITLIVAFFMHKLCLAQSEHIIQIAGNYTVNLYTGVLAVLGMKTGWMMWNGTYNGPAWFVCVLLLCYLLYFIIAKVCFGRRELYLLMFSIWFAIGMLGNIYHWNIPFLFESTCRGYMSFSMGLLMFEIYDGINKDNIKLKQKIAIFNSLILLSVCILSYYFGSERVLGNEHFAYVMVIWPCVVFVVLFSNTINKILSGRIFQYLGTISMSIFLWHWSVRSLMVFLADKTAIFEFDSLEEYVLYVILTFIVAIFSNKILEPKLISLFDKSVETLFCKQDV